MFPFLPTSFSISLVERSKALWDARGGDARLMSSLAAIGSSGLRLERETSETFTIKAPAFTESAVQRSSVKFWKLREKNHSNLVQIKLVSTLTPRVRVRFVFIIIKLFRLCPRLSIFCFHPHEISMGISQLIVFFPLRASYKLCQLQFNRATIK